MIKKIIIHPYVPKWHEMFEEEAVPIRQLLEEHCIDLHHIGSTSVPGLSAKEDLDILCVVDDRPASLELQKLGYTFKGELNIPLRYFFSKNTEKSKVNLHVVEPGHGFIGLNLFFRDYLRVNEDARMAYQELKLKLAADPTAGEKTESGMPRYTLQKNQFIKEALQKAGYQGTMVNFCCHKAEWQAAKFFRQKYFFDKVPIQDPYTWTFDHPDHAHFVFYQGVDIVGYAHIQLWPEQRAAIRIIVIDEKRQGQGLGQQFLTLIEKWLKSKGYKSVQAESRPESLSFYEKLGYTEMSFDDPENHESDPRDIPLGRMLL